MREEQYLFPGPKLKLTRARRHAKELATEIAAYVAREPFAVFVELKRAEQIAQYSWRGREDVPEEFSAILGDAVHNLRTALDILANDIVTLCGATPKRVYFPFGDSEEGLEAQVKEKLRGATPEIIDIVRAFRPYRGGNEVLRAMHDLDITDKHIRVLTAHASVSIIPKMRQIPSERPNSILLVGDILATPTVQIDMTGFSIPADVEVIGKVANSDPPVLVIAPDFPMAGKPALSALDEMISTTEAIISTFEKHFG